MIEQKTIADRELVRRLESWGRTYARNRKRPPDEAIDPADLQVERIVRRFEVIAPKSGVAMRAYFCSGGREDTERFRSATEECGRLGLGYLHKRIFYRAIRGGVAYVRDHLAKGSCEIAR